MEINITLYGAFKDLAQQQRLTLDCEPGVTVAELRSLTGNLLQDGPQARQAIALLQQSVFADERSVLNDDFKLENSLNLAIIPPVCGG